MLHLNPEQIDKYRALHGYVTPIINISEIEESNEALFFKIAEMERSTDGSLRAFWFSEHVGPEYMSGCFVCLKSFDGVWLPVLWKLVLQS